MATCSLSFLGTFRVARDGQELSRFGSEKARALLAYLAVEAERPHARTSLCGLLWPELSDSAALHNLSQTLGRLRSAIGDKRDTTSLLHISRQSIQWNRAGSYRLDVDTFVRLAASSDVDEREQAAAVYRGAFLAGFSVPGCPEFDEWLLLTREHLERLALESLELVAQQRLATGAYRQAEAAARRQLELDPWREAAHRQVMAALAEAGQRSAALAQYGVCVRTLDEQLGIAPEPETTALAEQIRAGALGNEAAQPAAHTPVDVVGQAPRNGSVPEVAGAETGRLVRAQDWSEAPDTGVLYGRAAEAAQLEHWLLHERCRLVAVLGMGGVGKTTLAATVARSVAGHFERVVWRSLLNAPPLDELLRPVLQALAGHTPAELPAGLDAQLSLLFDELRRQRCLLILDNAESLLDGDGHGTMRPGYEGYAQLLHRVAHSQHDCCLVLTSRERPQGLERWEADLPGVRALRLEGLDADAGQAILRARGLTGQAADARALVEHYSGHPLALKLVAHTVHELFGGAIAAFLREETPIFDDVRAVLDQQYDRLSPLEQQLLYWLAIEREPTSVAALRGNLVQPEPAGTFVEALRALQRRSLLERVGDGFTLQNVVIEYLTERLVAGVSAELLRAAQSGRTGDPAQRTLPDSLATLNRFALVKAQAKEYVRESQTRMILHPVVNRLLAGLGTAGLAKRVQAILAGLREQAPLAPGYAGGNLLNLLLHAGIDGAGYDFSRLCVWQAALQGRVGAGINFGTAELTGSTFTLTMSPSAAIIDAVDHLLLVGSDAGALCVWRIAHGQLELAVRTTAEVAERLVVSRDRQLVAAACLDHAVRVWSVTTGALLHTLEGHAESVQSVAFSHDTQLLATSSSDDTIYLWEVTSGQRRTVLRHPLLRRSRLAFRPARNGDRHMGARQLASGGAEQTICLWDLEHGQLTDELRGHTREIECLAWSADGTLLASGSHDGAILVWDVHSSGYGRLRSTLRGHSHIVRTLVFHPSRPLLASGSADGTVCLWDLGTGQTRHLVTGRSSEIMHLAFAPDGQALASVAAEREVRLWEVETGRVLQSLTGYYDAVGAVRMRPDGGELVNECGDGRIHLWDTRDGRRVGGLHGHVGRIYAFAYSNDSRRLASASTGAAVHIWDVASRTPIRQLCGYGGVVKAVKFSPDGRWLAGAGGDRVIYFWPLRDDAAADAAQPTRVLQGHDDDIETVDFSPDGRQLVSASLDQTAWLWSMDTGQVLHVLAGHTAALAGAAFSPRGDRIATISYDDTVRLWDVATGRCVDGWEGVRAGGIAIIFSPTGDLLAHSHNQVELVLRDVNTGSVMRTLRGHGSMIYGLDWVASEPILASGSGDGTVRLWDVDTGACVQILQPPGPYAGMNITGATGISDAQRATLLALGAVQDTKKNGMPGA